MGHLWRMLSKPQWAESVNSLAGYVSLVAGQHRSLIWRQEHFSPLINFNTFSQGEQIHVAAWPTVMPHPGGPAPYSMSGEGKWSLLRHQLTPTVLTGAQPSPRCPRSTPCKLSASRSMQHPSYLKKRLRRWGCSRLACSASQVA